ncbi:hypothetical protein [Aeromonas phage MJG]|uniref:Internal virion protein n=1 Tax=Aeromonas phage MJG TaxID=2510451 RepID=A0A5J6A1J9_9CAUD|nr:hypothetical protein [Aeromonas phage MJG]
MAITGTAAAGAAASSSAMAAATAVAVAASVAATALQMKNASDLAEQQAEAQRKNNEAKMHALEDNYSQLSKIEQDALKESADQAMAAQKDYVVARGRVNTMAAATGTAGMSLSTQLGDLERDKLNNYTAIQQTRQSKLDNTYNQALQMKAQAEGNMDISPISRPSYAAGALSMLGTIANGYGQYQRDKPAMDMGKAANPRAGG